MARSATREDRSTRPSFRGLAVGTLVVTLALLLGACTSARQASTSASSSPTKGGTLTYAVALDALPSGIYLTLERNNAWINNVFQPIIKLDPQTRQPQPILATKWSVAPDGRSVDITLRDDVTFQTGRKMTADDVKYTFEQAALPKNGSNVASIAQAFQQIDVLSPTWLKITFTSPQPSLFEFFDQTLIVDKDTYAGMADGSKVIGTGPYMFTDWKRGASFTLKKYPGYWDAKDVNLDSIQYIVTTDATAEISAVRSGRAQVASGLTATDAQSFAKNNQYRLQVAGGTIYNFGMDVTKPPFDNPKVRQAVAYAIDDNRINQQVLSNTGTVSDLYWSKDAKGLDPTLASRYTYDPAKAKQLIADAGATGASIPVTYGGNPVVRAIYAVVANNLTAIGLKPTSVAVDQPTFSANQAAGDLGPAFISLHAQVGLSAATMLSSMPTLRKGNPSKFWTPEYQSLRKALLEAPADSAGAAMNALSKYLLDQEPNAPIVQAPQQIVVSTTVQGVNATLRGQVMLDKAYVAK